MSSARKEIIARDFGDQAYRWELQVIREFRLGLLRQIKREDMERIKQAGFKFIAKTVAGRREELKTFVEEHPSLMADDVPKLIKNFKLLGEISKNASGRRERKEEYDEEEEEEEPKPKKKRAKKGTELPRPKVVEVESSSPDYSD